MVGHTKAIANVTSARYGPFSRNAGRPTKNPITKHSTHASISDTKGLLSQNRTE